MDEAPDGKDSCEKSQSYASPIRQSNQIIHVIYERRSAYLSIEQLIDVDSLPQTADIVPISFIKVEYFRIIREDEDYNGGISPRDLPGGNGGAIDQSNLRNKQIEMLISFLHLHGDEESFDNTAPNYQHFRLMLINMAYYKQSDRRSSLQSSAVQESKDCIVQFTAEAKAMLHGKDICDLFKHAELSFIILACRQSAVRLL
ncbi:MAG: hypothetical protein ACREBR_01430, partial [bacterium]